VPVARGVGAGILGGGVMASVGIYTTEERKRKIERLREKRRARIALQVKSTGGQYACRKSFADRRPRVGGRFVKMDDETKRYLSLTKPGVKPPADLTPPPALIAYAAATATTSPPHAPYPAPTAPAVASWAPRSHGAAAGGGVTPAGFMSHVAPSHFAFAAAMPGPLVPPV